jgi:hypothetical protein
MESSKSNLPEAKTWQSRHTKNSHPGSQKCTAAPKKFPLGKNQKQPSWKTEIAIRLDTKLYNGRFKIPLPEPSKVHYHSTQNLSATKLKNRLRWKNSAHEQETKKGWT